jgi:hypothetical protein
VCAIFFHVKKRDVIAIVHGRYSQHHCYTQY